MAISVCTYHLMVPCNYTKPPIMAGIINKKYHDKSMSGDYLYYIIDNLNLNKLLFGMANCILITRLNNVPSKPENNAKIKYKIPNIFMISRKEPTTEKIHLYLGK